MFLINKNKYHSYNQFRIQTDKIHMLQFLDKNNKFSLFLTKRNYENYITILLIEYITTLENKRSLSNKKKKIKTIYRCLKIILKQLRNLLTSNC